jgi:hypothetical protein
MINARRLGIIVLLAGGFVGAATVRADSGTVRWAPGRWAQAVHPAAETNVHLFRDIYDRSAMPEIRAKNPLNFGPIGLRYGPQTNDIAFLIFTGKRGATSLPDEMHLFIPGHPKFTIPKAFRGKQEDTTAIFDKVAFSVQSSGFVRDIQGEIRHGWNYPGYIGMDLTVTTIVGTQRTAMRWHLKDVPENTSNADTNKFRSFSFLGAPKLSLRAFGDGTQLSATVAVFQGEGVQWFLLPLQGMDKEITVTLVDSTGAVVETTRMITTPKTFNQLEGWTGKLTEMKKDQKYTVKAKMNLGPWVGDVMAEVVTLMIPKPF